MSSRNLLLVAALAAGLTSDTASAAPETWPTAGWTTSTPEEQGIDSAQLAAMLSFLLDQGTATHGILVVRHGRLVLEAYGSPYGPDRPYQVKNVANGLLSALVGTAIADGRLTIDTKVSKLFPGRPVGGGLDGVTVRHLLTMSSGLGMPREVPSGDDAAWLTAVLDARRVGPLGRFTFGEVNSNLLMAVLAETTGTPVSTYARQRIFEPLGIRDFVIGADAGGASWDRHRLSLLPRDMAKLGLLYLRKGVWEGKQLVPASWIEEGTRKQIDGSGENLNIYMRGQAYGYLWWIDQHATPSGETFAGYSAFNVPGQYVFVVPEKDLVVVFTGNHYCDLRLPRELMRIFVVPAARSEAALPPNPEAAARLSKLVEQLR